MKPKAQAIETIEKKAPDGVWVQTLAQWLKKTRPGTLKRARTMLSCDVKASKLSLFVPPDMAELQPECLDYLHRFARAHKLVLIEDRRRLHVQPMLERRQQATPMIARAIAQLLHRAGLPGKPPVLSRPHRLNDNSPHICMTQLLRMAGSTADKCKRVELPPNKQLINVLNNNKQTVTAYACKVKTSDSSTILSYFDSPHFRAIGYSAGTQYIVHVCLAGGPLHNMQLWTSAHTLTRTNFQFQLLQSPHSKHHLGLFYTSFYFDMESSALPWWVKSPGSCAAPVEVERQAPSLLLGQMFDDVVSFQETKRYCTRPILSLASS